MFLNLSLPGDSGLSFGSGSPARPRFQVIFFYFPGMCFQFPACFFFRFGLFFSIPGFVFVEFGLVVFNLGCFDFGSCQFLLCWRHLCFILEDSRIVSGCAFSMFWFLIHTTCIAVWIFGVLTISCNYAFAFHFLMYLFSFSAICFRDPDTYIYIYIYMFSAFPVICVPLSVMRFSFPVNRLSIYGD